MALIGTNPIGIPFRSGYSPLANRVAFSYHPIAATIDPSTVTAEASSRTLPSGYVTSVGEKVIPAGSVIRKSTAGSIASLWQVAATADTLVPGETLVTDHDWSDRLDLNQKGDVFDNGNVITARLQVGSTGQVTLAALRAACPALRFFQ